MNDADRFIGIPEQIIFQSYVQRVIDHLRLTYDPKFNNRWSDPDDYPQIFMDGENLIEFAENMIPEQGRIKDLGYLPFLAFYVCYGMWLDGYQGTITNFVYPEGDNYITPENMGAAGQRFPGFHGAESYEDFQSFDNLSGSRDFVYEYMKLNLTGDLSFTYPKYYVAKKLDLMLDVHNALIRRQHPFYYGPESDYYKVTDLYCTWNIKTFRNGNLHNETDTTNRSDVTGYFGWRKNEDEWIEEVLRFRLEIHSKSEFRYKFIVLTGALPSQKDFGGCDYEFSKEPTSNYRYSVIYESPDWCLGDHVFEYDFVPGSKPAEDALWSVRLLNPVAIIYPEYPDRLKELLEKERAF